MASVRCRFVLIVYIVCCCGVQTLYCSLHDVAPSLESTANRESRRLTLSNDVGRAHALLRRSLV